MFLRILGGDPPEEESVQTEGEGLLPSARSTRRVRDGAEALVFGPAPSSNGGLGAATDNEHEKEGAEDLASHPGSSVHRPPEPAGDEGYDRFQVDGRVEDRARANLLEEDIRPVQVHGN